MSVDFGGPDTHSRSFFSSVDTLPFRVGPMKGSNETIPTYSLGNARVFRNPSLSAGPSHGLSLFPGDDARFKDRIRVVAALGMVVEVKGTSTR